MVDLDSYLDSMSTSLLPDVNKHLWDASQHPRGLHGEFEHVAQSSPRVSQQIDELNQFANAARDIHNFQMVVPHLQEASKKLASNDINGALDHLRAASDMAPDGSYLKNRIMHHVDTLKHIRDTPEPDVSPPVVTPSPTAHHVGEAYHAPSNESLLKSLTSSVRPGEVFGETVHTAIAHPVLSFHEKSVSRDWTRPKEHGVPSNSSLMNLSISGKLGRNLPNIESEAQDLHQMIEKSTVVKPILVQRNIHAETALKVFGGIGSTVGKTFMEKRFVPTTANVRPDTAFGPVYLRYHVPPGARALDIGGTHIGVFDQEQEVLLLDHQGYTVSSDAIDPIINSRVIELETTT